MSDTPTMLQDRLASMAHAFSDEGRKYAVGLLAADVGKLERELTEARHRIRTLIEERDSARIQADHKWKLREEFEALLGTDDVATGVERIKEAKRGAARYEVVRKMNAVVFKNLFWRCIEMDLRFDDEVDKLSETRTIRMRLNVKEEEKP